MKCLSQQGHLRGFIILLCIDKFEVTKHLRDKGPFHSQQPLDTQLSTPGDYDLQMEMQKNPPLTLETLVCNCLCVCTWIYSKTYDHWRPLESYVTSYVSYPDSKSILDRASLLGDVYILDKVIIVISQILLHYQLMSIVLMELLLCSLR